MFVCCVLYSFVSGGSFCGGEPGNESNGFQQASLIEAPQASENIDECPLIRVVEYCLRTIGTGKTVRYTE